MTDYSNSKVIYNDRCVSVIRNGDSPPYDDRVVMLIQTADPDFLARMALCVNTCAGVSDMSLSMIAEYGGFSGMTLDRVIKERAEMQERIDKLLQQKNELHAALVDAELAMVTIINNAYSTPADRDPASRWHCVKEIREVIAKTSDSKPIKERST